MYELDLTFIRLDIESREKSIKVSVINKLGIFDNDSFVGVVIVILQSFDAKLEIEDESGRYLYLLAFVYKAGPFQMRKDPHNLYQDVY